MRSSAKSCCWAALLLHVLCVGTAASLEVPGLQLSIHGFTELRVGSRIWDDRHQSRLTLAEARLQLELRREDEFAIWQVRTDFLQDLEREDRNFDLNTGKGHMDLREANVMFSPIPYMDIKLGRQILTWGTGDLVFLNDLFPKDWQSFLLGRDSDYLKAPSDAVMVSLFPGWAAIDIVYTPQFDADRYVRGERLSYWDPMSQSLVGQNGVLRTDTPDSWFSDDEWALRITRTLLGYELALYGYDGFWKSPAGFNAATGAATFPRLRVYGASSRGIVAGGVGNIELAYYASRDDRGGDNPLVPNDEWRLLAGYMRDLGDDFVGSVQYYVEWMQDYAAYQRSLPPGTKAREEARHDVTVRFTKQLLKQTLTLSLFLRYSLTDNDVQVRPTCTYSISDNWTAYAGANLFAGQDDHTFLGQFENNTNVYAAVRFSF